MGLTVPAELPACVMMSIPVLEFERFRPYMGFLPHRSPEAGEKAGHVPCKVPDGLYPLLVRESVPRLVAEDQVPVGGAGHDHVVDQVEHQHLQEGDRMPPAPRHGDGAPHHAGEEPVRGPGNHPDPLERCQHVPPGAPK